VLADPRGIATPDFLGSIQRSKTVQTGGAVQQQPARAPLPNLAPRNPAPNDGVDVHHLTLRNQEKEGVPLSQIIPGTNLSPNGIIPQASLKAGTFPGKSVPPSQRPTPSTYVENLITGASMEFLSLRREPKLQIPFDPVPVTSHFYHINHHQQPVRTHHGSSPSPSTRRKSTSGVYINPEVRFIQGHPVHAQRGILRSVHPPHQSINSFLTHERESNPNSNVVTANVVLGGSGRSSGSDRRISGRTGYKLAPSEEMTYANWMMRSNVN